MAQLLLNCVVVVDDTHAPHLHAWGICLLGCASKAAGAAAAGAPRPMASRRPQPLQHELPGHRCTAGQRWPGAVDLAVACSRLPSLRATLPGAAHRGRPTPPAPRRAHRGHGDGHLRLGDRIHRRADQGRADANVARHACGQVDVARGEVDMAGREDHIVVRVAQALAEQR